MNIKRIIIPLLLIILLASTIAFGANIPLGPYYDDTYFDLSNSALILKVVPHEKGGLEADVSAYDGLIKITGGATSNLTIGIGDDNIVEMDDADAAVDDYCKLTVNGLVGREYSEVKTDLSLNYVENLKVKLDGTQSPTVNDDVDLGYAVGSRWFDITNDKEYVCLDNTDGAAVWTETTGTGGGAGTYLELTDTPSAYDNGKYAKSTADGVVWDTPSGGYTNLTSFVDQTAWRLFYSDNLGDVTELAFGTDGQYLKSTGATSAPIFDTPAGAGDMLKATYDTDADGDIDVAAGGTEKSSWTQYCIPYLSGTTAFGEVTIGTAGQVLKVSAGATGYEFADESGGGASQLSDLSDVNTSTPTDKYVLVADGVDFESRLLVEADISDLGTYLENVVEDTTPELGGEMDSGAHSIGFTLQSTTGDGTTTIDWKLGNKFQFTFGAQNETFTFTAPTNPCTLMLTIIQDGTGSRTITWPATAKWPGGVAPTLTTTAGARDKIALDWDGTQYDGCASLDFK